MFNYTGKVTKINATIQVSEKFQKRTFVLTDGAASYPNLIEFQLTQKNCDLIEGVRVGDEVEVTFGLKGRNWTNGQGEEKTFNTLDVFRLKKVTASNQSFTPTPDDSNDLPF